jgi:hypothetical protein
MADKTPWKAKRQPTEGGRTPMRSSLGKILNQTPGSEHSTARSLSGVLGQGEKPMAPSSVVPLKKVMGQG